MQRQQKKTRIINTKPTKIKCLVLLRCAESLTQYDICSSLFHMIPVFTYKTRSHKCATTYFIRTSRLPAALTESLAPYKVNTHKQRCKEVLDSTFRSQTQHMKHYKNARQQACGLERPTYPWQTGAQQYNFTSASRNKSVSTNIRFSCVRTVRKLCYLIPPCKWGHCWLGLCVMDSSTYTKSS